MQYLASKLLSSMLILHGPELASVGLSGAVAFGRVTVAYGILVYRDATNIEELRTSDCAAIEGTAESLVFYSSSQLPTVVTGPISRVGVTLLYADPTRTWMGECRAIRRSGFDRVAAAFDISRCCEHVRAQDCRLHCYRRRCWISRFPFESIGFSTVVTGAISWVRVTAFVR